MDVVLFLALDSLAVWQLFDIFAAIMLVAAFYFVYHISQCVACVHGDISALMALQLQVRGVPASAARGRRDRQARGQRRLPFIAHITYIPIVCGQYNLLICLTLHSRGPTKTSLRCCGCGRAL